MITFIALIVLGIAVLVLMFIFGAQDFRVQPGSESDLDFDRELLPLHFDKSLSNNKELEDMQVESVKAHQANNLPLAIDYQNKITNSSNSPIPHINQARLNNQYNNDLFQAGRVTRTEYHNNQEYIKNTVNWAEQEINRQPERFEPFKSVVTKYLNTLKSRIG